MKMPPGGGMIGLVGLALVLIGFTTRAATPAAATVTPTRDETLARVFPTIVRIEAIRLRPSDGRMTKAWVGGSGVIISAQGHVLTNCHVADDADFFRCYLFDG